jgi:hypothetical protein
LLVVVLSVVVGSQASSWLFCLKLKERNVFVYVGGGRVKSLGTRLHPQEVHPGTCTATAPSKYGLPVNVYPILNGLAGG